MPKQNFKSHAKRKRQLAKLDKRQAKDQKRALRRTEASDPLPVSAVATAAPGLTTARAGLASVPPAKPLTLAEAVERWKNTKVGKPTRR